MAEPINEIDVEIPSQIEVSVSNSVHIQLKKSSYLVHAPDQLKQEFALSLPAGEYKKFLHNRNFFLTHAAKALQSLKWGFGIGSILKNHFQYRAEINNHKQLFQMSKNLDESARSDVLNSIQIATSESEERRELDKQKTFSQKSDEVILKILHSIDAQLWNQAPIVANSNEYGMLLSVSAQIEGGRAEKGWGGLTDIGISLGYNRDEKSLAIQIFQNLEKYKSTEMPAVFVAGFSTKAGFYMANQNEKLNSKGSSFYPPFIPAFSISTDRSFMSGFSTGLPFLNFPPSPIGDILTYVNSMRQSVLLRLTLSPLTSGFVRVNSGPIQAALKYTMESVKSATESVRLSFSKNKCATIFE